jgi:hypothetical protein
MLQLLLGGNSIRSNNPCQIDVVDAGYKADVGATSTKDSSFNDIDTGDGEVIHDRYQVVAGVLKHAFSIFLLFFIINFPIPHRQIEIPELPKHTRDPSTFLRRCHEN